MWNSWNNFGLVMELFAKNNLETLGCPVQHSTVRAQALSLRCLEHGLNFLKGSHFLPYL
jgi:hypothetical protein